MTDVVRRTMDELVDVLDASGNFTGKTAMKSEAHRDGLFHPTVHIWFYTGEGEILLQKRAENKDTFPGLWDVSVAGHVGAGEPIHTSAIREVKEEIGLTILVSDLKKIGFFKSEHRHSDTLLDCEYHHTFLSVLRIPLQKLIPQKSEVQALRLVSINNFRNELEDPVLSLQYVPHQKTYYQTVLKAITKNFL